MAKLFVIPILVGLLHISASLAQDIDTDDSVGDVQPSPIPNLGGLLSGILGPDRKRQCKEWETIELTLQDIDTSNPTSILRDEAVTIKNGNLQGHKIRLDEVYDFDNKTNTVRACACHIEGTPCVPLCCKPNHKASMKNGRLNCDITSKEDYELLKDQFARHLVYQEKLEAHRFVMVHHTGLNSLTLCDNAANTYQPGPIQRIEPQSGNLTLQDETRAPLDSTEYCFMPEKKGDSYHFTPVYCQEIKALKVPPTKDNNPNDSDPANEQSSPFPNLDGMIAGIFSPDRKRECEEWETIELTMEDIDLSNPSNILRDRAVTIKDGNLHGKQVPLGKVFDYNNKTKTARVCACDFEGIPCVPLCCNPNYVTKMKDGLFFCDTTTKEDSELLKNQFAKHLMDKEKLDRRFVIVHHNGLHSLAPCDKNPLKHTYQQGAILRIEPHSGNLTLEDDSRAPLDQIQYCFKPEKQINNTYHFTPVYCHEMQTSAKKSAGILTSPLPTIVIAIASIAVLFLAAA